MNLSKNHALWIALSLPVLMVILVAVGIYIPRLNAPKPQYDFVYALPSNDYYSQDYEYSVKDNKLQRQKPTAAPADYIKPNPVAGSSETRLYIHHVATNTSEQISFEKAQELKLDSNPEAPDGYTIEQGSGGGVFPFFVENNSYQNRYLVHGTYSQKVTIKGLDSRSYTNTQFLGWVLP